METIDIAADCEAEIDNCTPMEIKDSSIPLATSIGDMLTCLPRISSKCSISRVPRKIRELNEKAYIPQMVSIGPLHHGKPDLIVMENEKMRYLSSFLGRTTMKLENCVEVIKEWEERIRNCYAESISLSSDEFVKMVLLDSSFIIESFVRYDLGETLGFHSYVMTDLILLENQLPFFVLEDLFNLAFVSYAKNSGFNSFVKISVMYFRNIMLVKYIDPHRVSSSGLNHFVDLMRTFLLPSSPRSFPAGGAKFIRIQNATTLHEKGVRFKIGSSTRLPDIQYAKGELGIPRFSLDDDAEIVLRNLMALEIYLYSGDSYILDFIYFMDGLIDTPKDVDILVQNGVLENWLGDNSAVANLINNLTTEAFLWSSNFYYSALSSDLNSYCEVPWHNWKATLKRDYFSTPWRVASTFAAVVLLVLTFIQTVCSLSPR